MNQLTQTINLPANITLLSNALVSNNPIHTNQDNTTHPMYKSKYQLPTTSEMVTSKAHFDTETINQISLRHSYVNKLLGTLDLMTKKAIVFYPCNAKDAINSDITKTYVAYVTMLSNGVVLEIRKQVTTKYTNSHTIKPIDNTLYYVTIIDWESFANSELKHAFIRHLLEETTINPNTKPKLLGANELAGYLNQLHVILGTSQYLANLDLESF